MGKEPIFPRIVVYSAYIDEWRFIPLFLLYVSLVGRYHRGRLKFEGDDMFDTVNDGTYVLMGLSKTINS